jgi:hypothetical protein
MMDTAIIVLTADTRLRLDDTDLGKQQLLLLCNFLYPARFICIHCKTQLIVISPL